MSPAAIIGCSGIIFGLPAEPFALPGFTCIFDAAEFAKARHERTKREFYICDEGKSCRLWLCRYDGEKTPRNPRGEFVCDTYKPVVIRKRKP